MTKERYQKLGLFKEQIFLKIQFAQWIIELDNRMKEAAWLKSEFLELQQIRSQKLLPQEAGHENNSKSP